MPSLQNELTQIVRTQISESDEAVRHCLDTHLVAPRELLHAFVIKQVRHNQTLYILPYKPTWHQKFRSKAVRFDFVLIFAAA